MGGHHFTRDTLSCQKKLFVDEVIYEAVEINYANKDAKMTEEVELGKEASSAWKLIPTSSVATEERSDYDPIKPSN